MASLALNSWWCEGTRHIVLNKKMFLISATPASARKPAGV